MRLSDKLAFVLLPLFFILPVFGEDNDVLNVKVENLEKAIDAEANYLTEVGQKLGSLQADKKDLATRVDRLNAALSEKEKAVKELETTKNNPASAQPAVADEVKTAAETQALSQEKERLQKELEASGKKLSDTLETLSVKEKELAELKDKLAAAPKAGDEVTTVNKEVNQQLAAKDDQLKKLQGDIDQLKKDLEGKAAQGKEGGELVAQITGLKQELSSATEERKKIEEKLNARDSQVEELQDKLSRSQDPVKEAKEKLREALVDKAALEDQLSKVQKRLEHRDDEEVSVQKLKEEKRDLEKKLKDQDNQLEDSKDHIAALENELNKKESVKSTESNEVKKLRDEISDKEKTIIELEHKLVQKSALGQADVTSANSEFKPNEKLMKELEEKDQEIYRLKVVIKKAIERINALAGMPLPAEAGSPGR